MIKALQEHGFTVARRRGSHCVMRHPDGRVASIPDHKGRDLPKGTLRGILRNAGLTIDDLDLS